MSALIGQLAALGTSFAWAAGSVLFTMAGHRVGSVIVNRTRLVIALILVGLTHWILMGELLPLHAAPYHWEYLALSGLIGFAIGDSLLFQAFVMIGPRISMLLMALAPVFSTLLGWIFLHENLTAVELLGIGVTLAGVATVVLDRPVQANGEPHPPRHYATGLLLGLGAGLGQATGLLFSKLGLAGDFPALSGNVIRLTAATLTVWLVTAVMRQVSPTIQKLREEPRALGALGLAAIAGPFVGVWLSLIAVQRAPLGIASTLMSLPPVILIPVAWIVFKDKIGVRAIIGTLVAIAGTAILFLPG